MFILFHIYCSIYFVHYPRKYLREVYMAGGLFGKPFALNIKCVVFSFICMALFLYCPQIKSRRGLYLILFIIFVVSYVAMAWYDYYFDCRILPLKRGEKSTLGRFKPPTHSDEKQRKHLEDSVDVRRKHYLIYFSHLLFIVPLLAYIAVKGRRTPRNVYVLIGALAGATALYHGYEVINLTH